MPIVTTHTLFREEQLHHIYRLLLQDRHQDLHDYLNEEEIKEQMKKKFMHWKTLYDFFIENKHHILDRYAREISD